MTLTQVADGKSSNSTAENYCAAAASGTSVPSRLQARASERRASRTFSSLHIRHYRHIRSRSGLLLDPQAGRGIALVLCEQVDLHDDLRAGLGPAQTFSVGQGTHLQSM